MTRDRQAIISRFWPEKRLNVNATRNNSVAIAMSIVLLALASCLSNGKAGEDQLSDTMDVWDTVVDYAYIQKLMQDAVPPELNTRGKIQRIEDNLYSIKRYEQDYESRVLEERRHVFYGEDGAIVRDELYETNLCTSVNSDYAYDERGRLVSVVREISGNESETTAIVYDDAHALFTQVTRRNGEFFFGRVFLFREGVIEERSLDEDGVESEDWHEYRLNDFGKLDEVVSCRGGKRVVVEKYRYGKNGLPERLERYGVDGSPSFALEYTRDPRRRTFLVTAFDNAGNITRTVLHEYDDHDTIVYMRSEYPQYGEWEEKQYVNEYDEWGNVVRRTCESTMYANGDFAKEIWVREYRILYF